MQNITINSDDIRDIRTFLDMYEHSNLFSCYDKEKFDNLYTKLLKLNVALFNNNGSKATIKGNVILIKC